MRLLFLVLVLAVIGPLAAWPRAPGPTRANDLLVAPGQPLAAARLFAGRLDLNQASEADLVSLPGIGPTRARAILARRRETGGFSDVDDLRAVHGIGRKTLARLRDLVEIRAPDGPTPEPSPP